MFLSKDTPISHENWFLHPVEGPQRVRRWIVYIWQFFLFGLRRVLGIKPKIYGINIGGGPNWCKAGWANLEEVQSFFNPKPTHLHPEINFEFEDNSIDIIYTSHCFEHLDTPTVERCVEESSRVLKSGGEFIVKFPDFDEIQKRWLEDDATYFSDYNFNYNSVRHTWKNRGLNATIDHKAVIQFCGFWNDAYGRHYFREVNDNKEAYFGPPLLPAEDLRVMAQTKTPNQISQELRQHVLDTEPSVHFNHQNAWSREELGELLARHGFEIQTFDRFDLKKRYRNIPGFDDMEEASLFCLAIKK